MGSRDLASGEITGAFDYYHYDGPWEKPDDFTKLNGLLRFSRHRGLHGWSLTAMGYGGDWGSTDQIPKRTADATVPLFGFIDPFPGGDSSRYSLSTEHHWVHEASTTRLNAYAIRNDLNLVSNFTYCLDNGTSQECSVDDDQFLQFDERLVLGGRFEQARYTGWFERTVTWRYGGDLQHHTIDNGLAGSQRGELRPDGTIATYDVDQLMLGVFSDLQIDLAAKIRLTAGIRGDYYDADVVTELEANTGSADDSIVSPKLSLVLGPWNRTEVYLNWGRGFHSNDARGWVATVDPVTLELADPADPLVRAQGADIGFRTTAVDGLQSTVSAYWLELDSELVFLGDAATTELGPPSRRLGVEIANFYRVRPWLSLDLDLTLTDSEFTDVPDEESEIPGSVGRTVQAGISLGRPTGWFGTLRWRYFGDIPLTEDGLVEGASSSLVNGRLGFGVRQWTESDRQRLQSSEPDGPRYPVLLCVPAIGRVQPYRTDRTGRRG
jgi:outer membrane receptor protein involved in Fe transport